MKKKALSLLLVLCLMLSVLPFGASAADFTDVEDGAYYAEAVYWAVNSNPQITNGVDPTHFAPGKTCTRDQVVTFLWRALGKQKAEGTNPFVDVNKDAYYYDAVRWAVERNITNGTDATHFSPGKACTRGEVATFLWRAMQKPTASLANPFKDVKKGEFYEQAVLWAYEAGVTNGTTATAFSPNNTCTRGQIVTFLYRTFNPEYFYLTVKETITQPDGSQFGYTWKYDDRGNNIRSATLDGSVWEEYTYDDAGNRISCTNSRGETYKIDNSGSGDEGPWKVDTKFDSQGRVIEEIRHYDAGDEVTRYTYDAQGNLVQIEDEWIGGWKRVEKITCDKDGNWLSSESWVYNEKGELQSDTTYYYDAETGEMEKWTEKYPDGSSAVNTSQLEFDEEGFLKSETVTRVNDDGQGSVTTTVTVYEYVPIPATRMLRDWPTRYYPEVPED